MRIEKAEERRFDALPPGITEARDALALSNRHDRPLSCEPRLENGITEKQCGASSIRADADDSLAAD